MTGTLILASASEIRRSLLEQAQVPVETIPARVDEQTVKASLLAEEATPRDIADALAELKARKVSDKTPDALVLGCDQVLEFDGKLISKAETQEELIKSLGKMSGKSHRLFSAVVICEGGKPIWRHVSRADMMMHNLSDAYLQDYVARNWDDIRYCVGGYMLEGEGVRLFSQVRGDYFTVLGLPLLELLSYLGLKGLIAR